jgi:hypothetical protein
MSPSPDSPGDDPDLRFCQQRLDKRWIGAAQEADEFDAWDSESRAGEQFKPRPDKPHIERHSGGETGALKANSSPYSKA